MTGFKLRKMEKSTKSRTYTKLNVPVAVAVTGTIQNDFKEILNSAGHNNNRTTAAGSAKRTHPKNVFPH